MSGATPARRCALSVLCESGRRGAYVRDLLDAVQRGEGACPKLEPREAAFARRLALGVTAASGCLDEALNAHLRTPGAVSTRVRQALRIAAFELIYLGTPPEVAVSQGVELVRRQARAAAGLANAVLHRVAEGREAYLAAADVPAGSRQHAAEARRAGLPLWLADTCRASLGNAAASLFACQLEPAPVALCLNPHREPFRAATVGENDSPAPEDLPEGCAIVDDAASLIRSGALSRGDAAVSDVNAQRVALDAVRPGSLLEVGAGRGTKTFVMAAAAARRELSRDHVALDLSEEKCQLNRSRLERAGLDAGIRVIAGDATDLDRALAPLDGEAGEKRQFDTVLLDAPCSGTGTMRRHPEIPWRLTENTVLHDLPRLQRRLLAEAASRVASGGRLVYATCSVLAPENDGVVDAFLASAEGSPFKPVSHSQTVPAPGDFDGHYHVVLER